jgi:hypothetical protein
VIEKVISGGQVGADIAALRAASRLGIPTGGWCPAGWRTLAGPNKALRGLGLREHPSPKYPPRTFANVRDSDATIRIASTFDSAGEKCTLRAIRQYGKPYHDIPLFYRKGWRVSSNTVRDARAFLEEHDVRTLNVAGNASANLEVAVEIVMTKVLEGR